MHIRWFEDVGAGDLALVGGKGANLGEMARAGLPVPPGFCVTTTAYRELLDQTGLWPQIASALQDLAPGDPLALEAASAQIRQWLEWAPMPDPIASAVRRAYRQLGGDRHPVAVRSSATAEDLPGASFAGQQETYLNVRGEDDLLRSVQRCWASLWTARAIAYRERHGFDHQDVHLAVVVQRMVNAETAGVLFTADPIRGTRNELVINAAYGLGESVVSGRVTPDVYRLTKHDPPVLVEASCGAKETAVRYAPDGGTVAEPVAEADRERYCLGETEWRLLADLGRQVEGKYGAPQDIEWAVAQGHVYLLQTRPITTLAPENAAPQVLSRMERTILDDILEHYPDPPYPLDYRAVTDGYEQVQGLIRRAGLAAAPAERIIRMDEEGIPSVAPIAPSFTWRLFGLPWAVRQILREAGPAWDAANWTERLAVPLPEELTARTDRALAGQIEEAVAAATAIGQIRFQRYIGPMILRGAILRILVRLAGGRIHGEADLLGGLSYKSLEIDHALHQLAGAAMEVPHVVDSLSQADPKGVAPALTATAEGRAFLERVAAFLLQHGARTMKVYLPFSNSSWSEDPVALWATLAAIVRAGNPSAPEERVRSARERFDRLRNRVESRLPGPVRRLFQHHLERFRREHVAREATLYSIEEAFLLARTGVLEAGRRLLACGALPAAGDVVYLTLPELLDALRDDQRNPEQIRQRVTRRRRSRSKAVAAWRRHGAVEETAKGERPPGDADLTGLAGSPGQATGPVKVISGPREFAKLQSGDILVCSFTDPAWTPLFALAAGVIADTGGPLSHAAIVAREYGIPAVLGTGVATTQLRDGEVVTVDGDRGLIRRVGAANTGN